MNEPHRERLEAFVRDCTDEAGLAWLADALGEAGVPGCDDNRLATLAAMAPRRLGREPCADPAPTLDTPHGPLSLGPWSAGDGGRALLVLCAPVPERVARYQALFRLGDAAERTSLVRALALCAPGDALKEQALDAGRTNSVPLFAALALGNPYPASVYSEHEFNHLVLKTLFLELPVAPIVGLERRANPELSRMCTDYVDERRAAGRAVPAGIWLALAPHMEAHGRELLLAALEDPSGEHRRDAAVAALTWHPRDAAVRAGVARFLEREADDRARAPVAALWSDIPA